MPYIEVKDRAQFDNGINALAPRTVGELNYVLTKICWKYLQAIGLKYTNINSVIGALECCKLEFYRRVASGYEDKKIAENGEVYLPTKREGMYPDITWPERDAVLGKKKMRYARFDFPDNGYEHDRRDAFLKLVLGNVYEIDELRVGNFDSSLTLVGINGRFNTVNFTLLEEKPNAR